jgi:NAD(P)-dependent dehydrogenase (short-subunit alcohol dehydrogenase family)
MEFSTKTVLITGASSGIGLCCARRLSQLGASLILVDRTPPASTGGHEEAWTGQTDKTVRVWGDVSVPGVMRRAVEEGREHFGRLDAAINCAGVKGVLGSLIEQADDALDQLYAVNVRGIFLSMKYELHVMAEQRCGSIVNVSSIYGLRSAQGFALYSATKHAVAGMTKGAALEVAGLGIRINAVAPGPVNTPFLDRKLSEAERLSPVTPLCRFAEPEEIANAILWLCSEEASYVTGAIMSVDGGMSAQSVTRIATPGGSNDS